MWFLASVFCILLALCLRELSVKFETVSPFFAATDGVKNANVTCLKNEFQSGSNGSCIPILWKSDLHVVCPYDHSDEFECKKRCKSGEFTCFNGECIYDIWVCDGDDDCDDGSDERNCTDWVKTCLSGEFQCRILDRMCIHGDWRCDGDYDCEDQSDEKNCNVTCKVDQFLCAENYCIPSLFRCDDQRDCRDGSDEIGCPTHVPGCTNDMFDCHGDGSKCIQYNLVCDGWNDCGNYEDERVDHKHCSNDNLCNQENGGCQHLCYRSPEGSFCSCHAGFQLANNSKTDCLDIDECLTAGVCSHTCVNTKGSYKCKCQQGYQLENGHFCKPTC